jgi:hypothetical protein
LLTTQVLIVENDPGEMPKWDNFLREVDPSIVIVWAFSVAEAQDKLFDSFLSESNFDLIISKAEFYEFNWRKDVQKNLMIVSQNWNTILSPADF